MQKEHSELSRKIGSIVFSSLANLAGQDLIRIPGYHDWTSEIEVRAWGNGRHASMRLKK